MTSKYIKPKSITWWASVVPLLVGLVKGAAVGFPELQTVTLILDQYDGGLTPAALINIGLAGIGLRAAIGDNYKDDSQ